MRLRSAFLLAFLSSPVLHAAVDGFDSPASAAAWQSINASTTKSFSDADSRGNVNSGSLKIQFPTQGSFTVGGVRRCVNLSPGEYFIGGQFAYGSALASLATQILVHFHNVDCSVLHPAIPALGFQSQSFVPHWVGTGWNDYRHKFTAPASTQSIDLFFNVSHADSLNLTAHLDDASITPVSEAGGSCVPSGTRVCLHDHRFAVDVVWEVPGVASDFANAVRFQEDESALFWFFGERNWEIQLKIIDACTLNSRYWVFFSATTDQKFTVTVTDTKTGAVKTYVSPAGAPAPARTDTNALAVCP